MAASIAALAALTGCKERGGAATPSAPQTGAMATLASLFPGGDSGSGASQVHMPSVGVGRTAAGKVEFVNTTDRPMTITHIAVTSGAGGYLLAQDRCTHVRIPAGGHCDVVIQHTASGPGAFHGTLTAETDTGATFTATVTGTAVEPATTSPVSPRTTTATPSVSTATTTAPEPSTTLTTLSPTPEPDGSTRSPAPTPTVTPSPGTT
jgi:hypothetical protein